MKRLFGLLYKGIILLSLVTLMTATVNAQTFTLRYFELRDLFHTPGVVKLSPNYQTVIEFQNLTVERVSSGRADQITAEVVDNTIRLRANQSVVNTDLTVTAGGRTALFTLQADSSSDSARVYQVRNNPPQAAQQGPPVQLESSSEPAPSLTQPSHALPEGVDFKTVIYHDGKDLILQYILGNSGTASLLADPKRLAITYGDITLPYTHVRVRDVKDNKLTQNATDYGTLLIKNAPQDTSKLELNWTLFREGSSKHQTVIRQFGAIPIGNDMYLKEVSVDE